MKGLAFSEEEEIMVSRRLGSRFEEGLTLEMSSS